MSAPPHHFITYGTVKDSLRMARGYWEAKDTHDDLDTEIQRKFNRGFPRDNFVIEDSRTAKNRCGTPLPRRFANVERLATAFREAISKRLTYEKLIQ